MVAWFARLGVSAPHAVFAFAAGVLTLLAWPPERPTAQVARFTAPVDRQFPDMAAAHFSEDVIASYKNGTAHSPSILAFDDGRLLATWFQGSAEAQRDVAIHASHRIDGGWSVPSAILSAPAERQARQDFVATLGNPALFHGADGSIKLAHVMTVLGGWSTSRIALRSSIDGGMTFGKAKVLRLSPFFNLSHLVRFPALKMADGLLGLPAYGEFVWGMTEIAVFDKTGRVVDKRRIGGGGNAGIQADLLWAGGDTMETFLRPTGSMRQRAYRSESRDAGVTWSDPVPVEWPNSGAPVCSERFANGAAVLASNEDERGRRRLVLRYRPANEDTWRRIDTEIVGDAGAESLSYCAIALERGEIAHMVYSRFSDHSIRHVEFNQRWLADHSAKGGG